MIQRKLVARRDQRGEKFGNDFEDLVNVPQFSLMQKTLSEEEAR